MGSIKGNPRATYGCQGEPFNQKLLVEGGRT